MSNKNSETHYFVLRTLLHLKYEYFLSKTHGFSTGGLYSPPEPCEARFITDAHTLFHVFWTVDKKPAYPIVRLGGARTIFNKTDYIV